MNEKLGLTEQLSKTIIRGGESWQFFAFIFGAVLVLVYGIIDETLDRRPLRLTLKVMSFVLLGYFLLLNNWVRNLLVAFLEWFKTESG